VRVDTDEGVHGVGEAFHGVDEVVAGAIEKFRRILVGRDATRVLQNWQVVYRSMRYPMGTGELAALSAIEHSLWDISGKLCGLPVYRMLGGPVRDRVRLYANPTGFKSDSSDDNTTDGTGYYGSTQDIVSRSKTAVKAGFTAIKVAPQPDDYAEKSGQRVLSEMVDRMKTLREELGVDIEIALDYHGRSFSPVESIRFARAIEEYGPLFLEEPALTEHPDALAEVKSKTSIPIAAGERAVTRDLVRSLIERRAVDILQPEPTANGGIIETIKFAAIAEQYGVVIAPHMAVGAIGLTVCAQIDAVIPNFLIQEYNSSVKLESEVAGQVFVNLPRIVDGYFELSDRPGLGIDFNLDAVAEHPPYPFDRPVVIGPDGSVALE
jgi:galactonate dehydratase